MNKLTKRALELAELGLYVFPVNKLTKKPVWAKRDSPNGRGGHLAATRDPDEIEALFERGTGIGVFLKKSGLICFDIDYREGAEKANDKLLAWQFEHLEDDLSNSINDKASVRVHLSQNGGEHWIYRYDEDAPRPPGAIFQELQVKWDGYIVWPTEGSNYEVDVDTPLDQLAYPPEDALVPVEAKEGATSSGGIMSYEAAIEVLRQDEEGQRHEAINALSMYHVRAHPLKDIGWHVDAVINDLNQHMPEGERKRDLMDVTYDPDSEVVRSIRPLMKGGKLRAMAVGDQGTDLLAKALAARPCKAEPIKAVPNVEKVMDKLLTSTAIEWATVADVKATDYPDIEWVVEQVAPAGNIIGLAGPSGAGKTRWVSAFIAAVANGQTEKMGLPECDPARILYIANEERVIDVHRRVKAAAISLGIDGDGHFAVKGKDSGVMRLIRGEDENDEAVDMVIGEVAARGVKLVIFDPFVTLGAEEENAAADVSKVIEIMQKITQVTGAAVMFIHHTPKGNEGEDMRGDASAFRGSGAIYSALDLGLTLFPYIPPAFFQPQKGRAMRRALALAQRAGEIPRFIVLDPAKERENLPLPPVYYRLDSVAVNSTGQEIGAVKRVAQSEADGVMVGEIETQDNVKELAQRTTWGNELLVHFREKGRDITASEIGRIVGSKAKRCQFKDPNIKAVIDAFETPAPLVDGTRVQLIKEGRRYSVSVSEK